MTNLAAAISAAALALALLGSPAMAADYAVAPVTGADGKVAACQATNEKANLSFLAAGDRVVLFAMSDKFPFAEDAKVEGTWSVDGSKPAAFTSDGGGAHMVAIEVPNDAASVALLSTGKQLALTAAKSSATFDLTGSGTAFNGLIDCMTKNIK